MAGQPPGAAWRDPPLQQGRLRFKVGIASRPHRQFEFELVALDFAQHGEVGAAHTRERARLGAIERLQLLHGRKFLTRDVALDDAYGLMLNGFLDHKTSQVAGAAVPVDALD